MAQSDEHYMQQALGEARRAFAEEEVPIGAVIVLQDKIIARGYNQVQKLNDSTAHAEMIALTSAFNFLGSKYLPGATLYVTVEPCLMCAGAIYWSQLDKVVFGAFDKKHGAFTLLYSSRFNASPKVRDGTLPWPPDRPVITGDICKDECLALIREFFKARR